MSFMAFFGLTNGVFLRKGTPRGWLRLDYGSIKQATYSGFYGVRLPREYASFATQNAHFGAVSGCKTTLRSYLCETVSTVRTSCVQLSVSRRHVHHSVCQVGAVTPQPSARPAHTRTTARADLGHPPRPPARVPVWGGRAF
jgi:hypothetical protein